ncbi:hypothetical protein L4D06_02225 [Enterovibrio makurazakiensis]|uniref:hypothetical protein n=1 Tax=Enterovibrio makurazakiensis TaxID=2910232 RepID=UPI003D1FA67F
MGSPGNLFGAAVAAAIHAVAASSLQDEIGNIQQSKPKDVDEPLDASYERETKYDGEPTQFDDDIVSVELKPTKGSPNRLGDHDGHRIRITLENGTIIDVDRTRSKEELDDPRNPSGKKTRKRFKWALDNKGEKREPQPKELEMLNDAIKGSKKSSETSEDDSSSSDDGWGGR